MMKSIYLILITLILPLVSFSQKIEWVKNRQNSESLWMSNSSSDGKIATASNIQSPYTYNNGSSSIPILGLQDAVISLNDSLGNELWVRHIFGSGANVILRDIKIDYNSDIVVLGYFSDSIDVSLNGSGNTILDNNMGWNGFVVKLNNQGDLIWAKQIESDIYCRPTVLAISGDGTMSIAGKFDGTADFDPSPNSNILTSTGADPFLFSLDANGNFIWAHYYDGVGPNEVIGMAYDSDTTVLINGRFKFAVDIAPGPVVVPNVQDGINLNYSGHLVRVHKTNGEYLNHCFGSSISNMIVDDQGEIYLMGKTPGSGLPYLHLNGDTTDLVANNYNTSIYIGFITKIDSDFNTIWRKIQYGSGIYPVAADNQGNVYFEIFASSGVISDTSVTYYDQQATSYLYSNSPGSIGYGKIDTIGSIIWAREIERVANNVGVPGGGPINFQLLPSGSAMFSVVYTDSVFLPYWDSVSPFMGPSNGSARTLFGKLGNNTCDLFEVDLPYANELPLFCADSVPVEVIPSPWCAFPVQYGWNISQIDTSKVFATTSGIVEVEMEDANGCQTSHNLVVDYAPDSLDFTNTLVAGNHRPGFPVSMHLDAINLGCDISSGILKFLPDPVLNYVSASVTPDQTSGDTLIWLFNALSANNNFNVHLQFNTSVSAQIGDTACHQLFVSIPPNDFNLTNNEKLYCYPIVNGYDPNDKRAWPEGKCEPNYIQSNNRIEYCIRFQNTGNSEAINISIVDTIDTDLDISDLKILSSSHEMYLEYLGDGVINFVFDDINLVDSSVSQTLSQGYVVFEIGQLENLPHETEITNFASIYFDFNPPIITNSVSHKVFDQFIYGSLIDFDCASVNVEDNSIKRNVSFYPNPTEGTLHYVCDDGVPLQVEICDLFGRLILKESLVNSSGTIDLGLLKTGTYLLLAYDSRSMQKRTFKINVQ